MDLRHLFDFKGCARRAEFWGTSIGSYVAMFFVIVIWRALVAFVGGIADILILLVLPIWVIGIAVAVRRLHDRGRSGWWLLLFILLPTVLSTVAQIASGLGTAGDGLAALTGLPGIVLSLWGFVEMGLLPTRPSSARYGGVGDTKTMAQVFE
jgi:uncharacterized membrane protein YhaH (DUF805 family)